MNRDIININLMAQVYLKKGLIYYKLLLDLQIYYATEI